MGILIAEGVILFAALCTCPPLMARAYRRKSGAGEVRVTGDGVTAEKMAVEKSWLEGSDKAEYALIVNGLSKLFGDVEVVKDVSLAVRPGECIGLLGANGSGKTTLLSMIAGILRTSRGECCTKAGSMSSGEQEVRHA
ncbi:hypothetical protein HPB50_028343 [Hyalomma asiaticum]|nr:hypothetical protein HPB50_028343 [Hyalomma asiaticum]